MTAFTVCHPNYQNLQKVGYDIVIFNGNVLGHAWHTWCKNGTNGKRMSCSLRIGYMHTFKSIDFRTMGLWNGLPLFWYTLQNEIIDSLICIIIFGENLSFFHRLCTISSPHASRKVTKACADILCQNFRIAYTFGITNLRNNISLDYGLKQRLQLVIPKVRYSEGSVNPKVRYSEGPLFRRFVNPKMK